MSRPLSDSVSLSELQHYRDEGYSNAQIAKLLDVSYQTVRRYLGAQPVKYMKKESPVPFGEPLPKEDGTDAEPNAYVASAPCESFRNRLERYGIDKPAAVSEPVVKPAPEPVEPVEEWTGGFQVTSRKVKAESATAKYYIDQVEGVVDVVRKSKADATKYTVAELNSYIQELMDVLELMEG